MGGRPTTPTALKILTGNPGRRKLPKREPQPKVSQKVPDPPIDMDARAQAVWRRVAPILAECRILTDGDLLALETLCNQEVMWREAMRMTLEKGLIMPKKNKDGEVVGIQESTYSMIAGKKMPELRAMYIQFGLTPAARVKIQAAGDDPNEGWDDF